MNNPSQHPMINLTTQSIVVYDFTSTWNTPNISALRRSGWRDIPVIPPVADGYQRGSITYIEGDGITASAQYTDTLISDILAQEVAAEAAALAAHQAAYNAQIQAVAQQAHIFRIILQKYFGVGAEANQAITQAYVQTYFVGLQQAGTITVQQLADASVLQSLYPILSVLTTTGYTWDFPWSMIP